MGRKNELIQEIGNKSKYVDGRLDMEWRKKINLLVSSWEMGLNDRQAAGEAGFDVSNLYHMFEIYPDLKELRDLCREKINIDAKKNIREAIKRGHLETSKWFLERTDPEFQKKDSDTTVNVAVISVADREKEMNKFMERFTDAGIIESVESEK